MSNAASYKQRKEDFVSNLSGGSVSEINYVTAVAPVAILLWSVLQVRHSFFNPTSLLGLSVDFSLNVGAILLATTLYSGSPLLLIVLLFAPALLVWMLPPTAAACRRLRAPPNAPPKTALGQLPIWNKKPFLTTYRGCMMIVTCVAILAVDFPLFPRRFAKVETWGTSLMDMGVGAFVFSGGVITARTALKERAEGRPTPLHLRLLQSMRHSVPLLILGFIRLLSVKGLDFAEHVTEYGVHWNFFFTLGFLPPFVAVFEAALCIIPSHAASALLVSGIYQLFLESTDLKFFILTGPRTDLLSKNREGIFSFFGYLSIFLAGQDFGKYIIPRTTSLSSHSAPGRQRNALLMGMVGWASFWNGLYLLSTSNNYGFGLTVSRRLANLPYILWVAAFNSWQVSAFHVVDTIFFPDFYNAPDARSQKDAYERATSPILRAYNRNGLALFLIANLLTGLVNMTLPTLDAPPIATMGILVAYMATVTGIAVVLDTYDISLKL